MGTNLTAETELCCCDHFSGMQVGLGTSSKHQPALKCPVTVWARNIHIRIPFRREFGDPIRYELVIAGRAFEHNLAACHKVGMPCASLGSVDHFASLL